MTASRIEMKEYLYVLKPTRLEMLTSGPTPEEADVLSRHVAYLQDLLEKDVTILFGRTQNNDESTFGLVIFRAEYDETARRIMEKDPAVEGGIMRGELFPYRVSGIRGGSAREEE